MILIKCSFGTLQTSLVKTKQTVDIDATRPWRGMPAIMALFLFPVAAQDLDMEQRVEVIWSV